MCTAAAKIVNCFHGFLNILTFCPPAAAPLANPDPRLESAWFEPSIHSTYYPIIGQWLATRSVAVAHDCVGQPRQLPLLNLLPMLEAVDAARQPQLGQALGLAIPVTAHGAMGLAALTSPTMAVGLEAMVRFMPLRYRLFHGRMVGTCTSVTLVLAPRLDLGAYAGFFTNVVLYSLLNLVRAMTSEDNLDAVELLLPWSAPQARLPGLGLSLKGIEYGSVCPAIRFQRNWMPSGVHSADPDLHRRMCQAGEQELIQLNGSMSAKVRHLLHLGQPRWPTLVEVAAALGLSRRTLIRKLEDEGLTYRLLLAETRNSLAKWYLRHTRLPLAVIADKVGFSDPGNFHRAFLRDESLSPSDYRKRFI